MTGRLSGEVALVTGAAQGIGLATARRLAADGAAVALTDMAGADAAAQGIDGARGWTLDVTDRDAVHAVTAAVTDALGPPTILVANAGIQRIAPSESMDCALWDQSLAVNLTGVWDCIQAVATPMLKARHGSIVTIASMNSYRGMPGRAPYCATKTAMLGLTRALASEWASRGVRVNAVAPGYVRTPMVQKAIDEGLLDEPQLIDRIPARDLADPSDIAAAIAFLCSPDARMITGQCLPVDGGMLAYGAPRPTSDLPAGFAS
ncbi:SDR family NAD(P)-dependent oxidoreductase [Jannaschia sp. LMIT008]|uniref:SDR family NAD(P)-dependent oxidoreductase n=1 Tax=Jannaschia maritima TaxID=3032585 RepID=UPI002812070A|nr:SDR family oxidoreductase [Jannaschia sp. LMIT008]